MTAHPEKHATASSARGPELTVCLVFVLRWADIYGQIQVGDVKGMSEWCKQRAYCLFLKYQAIDLFQGLWGKGSRKWICTDRWVTTQLDGNGEARLSLVASLDSLVEFCILPGALCVSVYACVPPSVWCVAAVSVWEWRHVNVPVHWMDVWFVLIIHEPAMPNFKVSRLF